MFYKILLPLLSLVAVVLLLNCSKTANKVATRPTGLSVSAKTQPSFFQFTVNSLDGKPVSLEKYRGKKIIVLNVASLCSYTPQYADWEKYYAANKDKVVVLGFPANDFSSQEPGSSKEIETFCQKNYGVTFPMFEKVRVIGDEKAPIYKWLTDPSQNGWNRQEPTWNFCKYLINEKGELTHFFASNVKPDSPAFVKAMKAK